jgi:hypothetical protein
MELIIEPMRGVGPVKLNMSKEQVHAALGIPEFSHGNREGFLSGLMVNFSPEGNVEFIELAKSEKYVALLNGIDVHATPALELVELISSRTAFDNADPELGYSYIFKDIQLSLWRSSMPESSSDSEGRYFESVGIGVPGYFV